MTFPESNRVQLPDLLVGLFVRRVIRRGWDDTGGRVNKFLPFIEINRSQLPDNTLNSFRVFRFDPDFQGYDIRKIENITPSGLNFTVLDSGVCVSLTEDEKLEVFSVSKGSTSIKSVEDPMLGFLPGTG